MKPDRYVIHKHAAWLCIGGTAVCGFMGGLLVGLLLGMGA